MTKMVWRPRCQDLLDLIVGTYMKSLKAPLSLGIKKQLGIFYVSSLLNLKTFLLLIYFSLFWASPTNSDDFSIC